MALLNIQFFWDETLCRRASVSWHRKKIGKNLPGDTGSYPGRPWPSISLISPERPERFRSLLFNGCRRLFSEPKRGRRLRLTTDLDLVSSLIMCGYTTSRLPRCLHIFKEDYAFGRTMKNNSENPHNTFGWSFLGQNWRSLPLKCNFEALLKTHINASKTLRLAFSLSRQLLLHE